MWLFFHPLKNTLKYWSKVKNREINVRNNPYINQATSTTTDNEETMYNGHLKMLAYKNTATIRRRRAIKLYEFN